MSSNYVRHLIGPDVFQIRNFPFVDYDPLLTAEQLQNASELNLRNYLNPDTSVNSGYLANRDAFNSSFMHIKTDIYDANGQCIAYRDPSSNQVISIQGYSIDKFGENEFANDMIAHLKNENVDFAHYVSHPEEAGDSVKGLEQVLTTDGSTVSVDPTIDPGNLWYQGITSALAGATLPLIGKGIKNAFSDKDASGNKNSNKNRLKGAGQLILGGYSNISFASNMIESANLFNSPNMVSSLLGLKGLLYNSGMFMIGLGAYSIGSAIKDYITDRKIEKGKKIKIKGLGKTCLAKGIFGGLELAAGGLFTYASGAFSSVGFGASMTSLIYEGAGLFSISTSGLSSLLSSTLLWGGIGLGVAGIVAGISYLVNRYKYNTEREHVIGAASASAATPHPVAKPTPKPAAKPVTKPTPKPAAKPAPTATSLAATLSGAKPAAASASSVFAPLPAAPAGVHPLPAAPASYSPGPPAGSLVAGAAAHVAKMAGAPAPLPTIKPLASVGLSTVASLPTAKPTVSPLSSGYIAGAATYSDSNLNSLLYKITTISGSGPMSMFTKDEQDQLIDLKREVKNLLDEKNKLEQKSKTTPLTLDEEEKLTDLNIGLKTQYGILLNRLGVSP